MGAPKNIVMDGHVAPGFEAIAQQFEEHLASGEEKGASFCVTHNGEVVAELWGGHSDLKRSKPWQQDTAALMFSVTKGLAALAMLKLHEAGKFDYDMPVAEIWPEFAQQGKGDITIRTLMNHRAGLPVLDQVLSMEQAVSPEHYDEVATILARQKTQWVPGEGQAYHATTYGMYVGELYRRLCNQPFPEYFQEHIAGPLEADVWVGTPAQHADRIAEIEAPSPGKRIRGMLPHIIKGGTPEANVGRSFLNPWGLPKRALLNPKLVGGGPELYNAPDVRKHPVLWGGAIGTAQGLARIFGALANDGTYQGTQIIQPESLKPVLERQGWSERDGVLGKPLGWSQGFLKEEVGLFSNNTESFGHAGLGGALGWADPVNHISIGYVTNTLDWRIRSIRCKRLCKSVYNSL